MSYYLPFDPSIKLGQTFGSNPNWGPNPAGGHNGDDWLTPIGTPVRAPGDGVVVYAGRFDSTYADNWGWNINYAGPMVILNMDGDTAPYFEFGHLSEVRVQTGQRVSGGQIVALTGADDGGTKVITGPHCHVGCLPPNFNLGSSTYGRVNPRIYMTKYWDGINLANSGTITPLTEDDDMFTQAEKDALFEAVARIDKKADDVYNRVFGRDVQRWYNPNTGEVRTDNFDGAVPARSTDVHDVLSSNNLLVSQTNKILEAVSKIPGVDEAVISKLRGELSAELKKATEGLQVTLTVKES